MFFQILMNSSDGFTNFLYLRIYVFFKKLSLFICYYVLHLNVNTNIDKIRRFVVTEFVKLYDEFDNTYKGQLRNIDV